MSKSPLIPLIFTIVLDMVGIGILIPILPQLFANPASSHYLLDPTGENITTGYQLLGLLMATYSIGQFFAAPIFGQLSDKLGRKKVLPWSIAGTGVGYIIFAIGLHSHSIGLLFFARALSGMFSGNIVVAQAAIGDISRPDNRARNFGLVSAAFGVGLILGPIIGGILADPKMVSWFSAATPFWFAALLSFFNVLFIVKVLPETHAKKNPDITIVFSKALHRIFGAWHFVSLRTLFITNFLFMFGFIFYTSFAPVFLTHRFQYSEGDIGKYYAFIGLCILISQVFLTNFVSKFANEEKVLKFSIWGTAFFVLVFVNIYISKYLYLNAPFFSMTSGLTMANLTALISKRAGRERQGEAMGLNGSVMAFAGILPLLASGFLAASFSPETPIWLASLVIFLAGGIFIAIGKNQPSLNY
ncbi:MAG: MFS transporter [Parachlamydiales bacterium]|jgi:DHA1 family tetracycline resistance protein-like MFS transporter